MQKDTNWRYWDWVLKNFWPFITIKRCQNVINISHFIYENGIKTTFDTDAGSELFKRTPLDLMKQHASLLTNILCLAITLSLVLVTGRYLIEKINDQIFKIMTVDHLTKSDPYLVVQFTGNEERWRQFNLKVDKLR